MVAKILLANPISHELTQLRVRKTLSHAQSSGETGRLNKHCDVHIVPGISKAAIRVEGALRADSPPAAWSPCTIVSVCGSLPLTPVRADGTPRLWPTANCLV